MTTTYSTEHAKGPIGNGSEARYQEVMAARDASLSHLSDAERVALCRQIIETARQNDSAFHSAWHGVTGYTDGGGRQFAEPGQCEAPESWSRSTVIVFLSRYAENGGAIR